MSLFTEQNERLIVGPEQDARGDETLDYRDCLVIEALADGLTLAATARVFRISRKHVERIRRQVPADVQDAIGRDAAEKRSRRIDQVRRRRRGPAMLAGVN